MSTEQQYPDNWPGVMSREQKPGMKVTGKLADARVAEGRNGKSFVIVDLDVNGTILSVPAWHYTLNDLLNEVQPKLGDELTIEYEGEKSLGNGRNPLKLYKVNGRSSQGQGGQKPAWFSGPAQPQQDTVQQVPEPNVTVPSGGSDLPF